MNEAAGTRDGRSKLLRPLIVIVEDDAALLRALRFSLLIEGYRVAVRESGEALLGRRLPRTNACLVLDHRLPGVSGLAALDLLRRREVTLPAILITSQPARALRRLAAALGATIVEKPLLADALSDAIEIALAS
jgi:two-component system response regulator FixJ